MDAFERAAQEIEREWDGTLENENAIEFVRNAKRATVTFTQGRFVRKIRKLKEKFPDLVEICHEEDGLIVAHIPTSAIKINIAPPREMTEEERAAARERLLRYRKKKAGEAAEGTDGDDDFDDEFDGAPDGLLDDDPDGGEDGTESGEP